MGKLSREDMIARRTENAKTRYTGDYVNNITQKTPAVNDNINTGNHNLNPKLQNIQFHPIDNKKRAEKLAEMVGKDVLVCEKEEIEEIVKNNKESNEIFIFMGAGSVSKVAHDITNKL